MMLIAHGTYFMMIYLKPYHLSKVTRDRSSRASFTILCGARAQFHLFVTMVASLAVEET